jgi:hypothetical protein
MPHIEAVKRQAIPKALVLFLAAGLLLPGRALAWGSEGHHIAAEIAEQFLEPSTVRQVRELLAIDNETTLAQASTWADEIRPQRPETSRWHYVNIPINPPAGTPPAYDARRDCPTGDCVVAKTAHSKPCCATGPRRHVSGSRRSNGLSISSRT